MGINERKPAVVPEEIKERIRILEARIARLELVSSARADAFAENKDGGMKNTYCADCYGNACGGCAYVGDDAEGC